MGLFADYLEETRERLRPNEIDPSLILGRKASPLASYHRIESELVDIENKLNNPHAIIQYKKEIAEKSAELESVKMKYLVAEKILLRIHNECSFKSILMKDLIAHLLYQYQDGYREVCALKQRLEVQASGVEYPVQNHFDDSEVEQSLLFDIIRTIVGYLENGASLDTSMVRKIINDCSIVIKQLEHEDYNKPSKAIVSYYLEVSFGMKRTKILCNNCGLPLFSGLHYCLNCYERNHEE